MNTNEDFKAFYEKYLRFSIGIAKQIVKDEALAEDISQEVFYHLYRVLGTLDFTNERKLRALVIVATEHKAIDYLRKNHVKAELLSDKGEEIEAPDENLEELVLKKEEKKYKKLVLQKLREENPMNYDILIKIKVLGISPDTVAEEYGITRNGINNRILRTKRWLSKELRKMQKED